MKPARGPAPIYWVKRIDNSRLVRQRAPGAWRDGAAIGAVAGVCLSVALFCAFMQFQYLQLGYRLERLRAEQEQQLEWNRELRLEQASLLDPMRIDALARGELGLEAPAAGQLILLGPQREATAERVYAQAATGAQVEPATLTD